MKYLISILAFVCLTMNTNAQQHCEGPDHTTFAVDTVTNSTGVTFTSNEVFNKAGYFEAYVVADSLSGSTSGSIIYEYAYDATSPTYWQTKETDTVNGVQSLHSLDDATFTAKRFRIRVTGGGTQSTKITPYFCFTPF